MQTTGTAAPAVTETSQREGLVAALIAAVAAGAAATLAVLAPGTWSAIHAHPLGFVGFVVAGAALQLKVIEVPDDGAVSFANVMMLGASFALGAGPGMLVAVACALVRFAASDGRVERAVFDVATLALSAAAAQGTYHVVHALDQQQDDRFGPSLFAGAVFYLVNVGLLSVAMSLSEGQRPGAIWRRRFRWLAPYAVAAGPFAAVAVVAYERIGVLGILAMAIAPAVLVTPVRKRITWSR